MSSIDIQSKQMSMGYSKADIHPSLKKRSHRSVQIPAVVENAKVCNLLFAHRERQLQRQTRMHGVFFFVGWMRWLRLTGSSIFSEGTVRQGQEIDHVHSTH